MNIGDLMRNFMGNIPQQDVKSLDLKVGQVVKGIVLQILANQEALMNIGGVHVRAALETPLKQGEISLLQVMPQSQDRTLVLKPLHEVSSEWDGADVPQLLKQWGLKDVQVNRQLVQQLLQNGTALTKEQVKQIDKLTSLSFPGKNQEQWSQSVLITMQKGLPLTKETVLAVQQVHFGKPLHRNLQQLSEAIQSWLKHADLTTRDHSLASKTLHVLREIEQFSREIMDNSSGNGKVEPKENPLSSQRLSGSKQVHQQQSEFDLKSKNNESKTLVNRQETIQFHQNVRKEKHPNVTSPLNDTKSAVMLPSQTIFSKPLLQDLSLQTAKNSEFSTVNLEVENSIHEPLDQTNFVSDKKSHAKSGPNVELTIKGQPFLNLLKLVGVSHEHHIADSLNLSFDKEMVQDFSQDISKMKPELTNRVEQNQPYLRTQPSSDTLKGLLMQLIDSSEIPSQVKDIAQQVIQQVTGQQLLLTTDQSSLFTNVTLFLPIMNKQGDQTAAIHIQSRKGKNGQLDANNCRLLFHLQMKMMGETMVDVQVVDRIVSLQIYNNQDGIASLFEQSREEIRDELHKLGYQFISLKTNPLHLRDHGNKEARQTLTEKPYKGLDYRI